MRIIKSIKIKGVDMKFMFNKSVPYYILNMFRCVFINHTSSYALTNVYIHTNSSLCNDQIIKQRLTLLPIHIPVDCLRKETKLIFKIDKKNENKYNIDITTNDFMILMKENDNITFVKPDTIFPKYPESDNCIPIVTLYNSHKDTTSPCLQLEATLSRNVGASNICFSPVSVVSIDEKDNSLNVEFLDERNIESCSIAAMVFIRNQLELFKVVFHLQEDNTNVTFKEGGKRFSFDIDVNMFPIIYTLSIYLQNSLSKKKIPFVAFKRNHPLKAMSQMHFEHCCKSLKDANQEINKSIDKLHHQMSDCIEFIKQRKM